MTGLPKKAILQPRVLDPGFTKGDWTFIIVAVILVSVTAILIACTIEPSDPPKTYEDCKSKEAQEEFLRNEIHQFLEKELNK